MNKTINEIQDEIIEQFSMFDDWMDKYSYIIEIGNNASKLDEKFKTDNNLISGCQSQIWIKSDFVSGKIIYQCDSDSLIVKGLACLFIKVLSNRTPEEIITSDIYFIDKIGLKENLSPNRSNGINSMLLLLKNPTNINS